MYATIQGSNPGAGRVYQRYWRGKVRVGLVGAEGGAVPVVGLVRSVVVLCLRLPLLLGFFLSWRHFGNRRRPGVVSVDLNAGTSV
jgi:hypothetical protein